MQLQYPDDDLIMTTVPRGRKRSRLSTSGPNSMPATSIVPSEVEAESVWGSGSVSGQQLGRQQTHNRTSQYRGVTRHRRSGRCESSRL